MKNKKVEIIASLSF